MPQQVTNIKKRIASIKGAYKITSAMKLVSTVKLKKWRKTMLENKIYADAISSITSKVFASSEKVNSPYFEVNSKAVKKLYIIISSTLGLCGSYNNNILRLADSLISKEDDLLILGGKALAHYVGGENLILPGFENVESISDMKFQKELLKVITSKYLDGTYSEIHLIYSEYINALTFRAKDATLLPLCGVNEAEYFLVSLACANLYLFPYIGYESKKSVKNETNLSLIILSISIFLPLTSSRV